MIPTVAIRVVSERTIRGPKWAAKYPEKANDIWVVGHANGNRVRLYFGSPTPENVERAEHKANQLRAAVDLLRGKGVLGSDTFGEAAAAYLETGLALHELAPTTREDRRFMLAESGSLVREIGACPLNRGAGRNLLRRARMLLGKVEPRAHLGQAVRRPIRSPGP